jgi:hypothetical protein
MSWKFVQRSAQRVGMLSFPLSNIVYELSQEVNVA